MKPKPLRGLKPIMLGASLIEEWLLRAKTVFGCLIFLGGVCATPLANGQFDINTLSVDEENRFSNVGAFIVAVVDDDGNVIGRRTHCTAVLIHKQALLTAGHCVGPGKFGVPPFLRLVVSFSVNALDQTTWLPVARVVPHPSLPPCPPPGCDPTTRDIFHAGDPGINDHGLIFLTDPVPSHIVPAKLAAPGTLGTSKGATTPLIIVGYPSPNYGEDDWDGLRRVRASSLVAVLDEDWATFSLPSNVCAGDSGGPIFLNLHPGAHKQAENEPLVANVSDGGVDCLSANTNARADTIEMKKWIHETLKDVLGEESVVE